VTSEKAVANLIKALGKGVLKVMSKMGISTVASYRGAQVFEASVCPRRSSTSYFTGTVSQLGGVGLDVIAKEVAARHARRTRSDGSARAPQPPGSAGSTSGVARASRTSSTPRRSSGCSTPPGSAATTSSSSTRARVDEQSERLMTLRGLFELRGADHGRERRSVSTRSSRSARSSSGSTRAR
jgi:glutamate synthase (NADPH/NADH) large chain